MAGKSIGDYKNTIIYKLLEDENLLRAIVNNDSDFLSKPLPIPSDELIYSYIYPYQKVTNILTETKSFITMKFERFKPNNSNHFYSGRVYFYILCHESLIRTDYGNRHDYIVDRIRNLFDHNRNIGGIGECIVSEISDISANDGKYFGSACEITIKDFKTGLSQ